MQEPVPPLVSIITNLWSPHGYMSYGQAVWESSNRIVFQPIIVPAVCVVRRLWWVNGGTVSASYNFDVGIYTSVNHEPGARLVATGSTAQGNASEVQFVDVTDTVLTPGAYWLAMVASSSSAGVVRASAFTARDHAFRFEQAGTFPLPATATPEESSQTRFYLFGFATTSSP